VAKKTVLVSDMSGKEIPAVRARRHGQVRGRPQGDDRHGREERGGPGDREERPQAGKARSAKAS
jgi:hypothetical protein